jgi:N-acetylneuraminic acid mutarotase
MVTPLDGPPVLLADGRVLVAGGSDGIGNGLSGTEVFDPETESWTETGDLIEHRGGHTATLLPDGRVLVAGGEPVGGLAAGGRRAALSSAEVYDPNTRSWTATGSMVLSRIGHTATLLSDGRVLVAGGQGVEGIDGTGLSSAELYDPTTGSWTATDDMINARRYGHTATLLPDGTVLVTGGVSGRSNELSSSERYDPRTGSWTAVGRMRQAGIGRTATLLPDGTVLVVGSGGGTMYPVAELYDPGADAWTLTGRMIEPRGYHSATLLPDGRVLVAGGANGTGDHHVTNTAELYDPMTGSWLATGSLALPRKFHSAMLLADGRVLVVGGTDGPGTGGWHRLATAELYGPPGGH